MNFEKRSFILFQTMAKMGVSMIRAWGITTTMDYFLNGLLGGISQELGRTTMENLCNAISRGDKESFGVILSNNGSSVASLSFPIGRTYLDVDSAWLAVSGISIQINGDISSSGLFTAVPVYLLLPFTKEVDEPRSQTQFLSSIIRMEFEASSTIGVDLIETTPASIEPPKSRFPSPKQSYVLKSVEFFFDF